MAAHSYWRWHFTANNGAANVVIGEIEARATVGGADQCTGGTVTSSEPVGGWDGVKAFDNDIATGFAPNDTVNYGYVQYQFASPVNILEYSITTCAGQATNTAPKDWTLKYSDNGTDFTIEKTVTNETGWASGETRVYPGQVDYSPIVTDTVVVADLLANTGGFNHSAADSTSFSEYANWFDTWYEALTDVTTAADVLQFFVGINRSNSETLAIADAASIPATGKLAADSLALADSQIANVGKIVADYLLINQTINTNWTGTRTLTETIPLLDTVTGARAYLLALADAAAIPDTALRALGFVTAERLTVRETVSPIGKYNHSLAERFILLTTLVGSRGFKDTLAESITATDALALLVHRICSAADTLAAADTVTPLRTAPITQRDSITLTETLASGGKFTHLLTDAVNFRITITLNGETYQCWSFSPDDMFASLYTNYAFNSFASLDGHDYGCNSTGGIYILEGDTDAGTTIERGIRVNYASMGTHLKKRLFHAFFGLVGEEPVLKVITDSGEAEYYVVGQKSHIAKGLNGVNWELILTQIDSLDFIEVTPVILSR